MAESREEGVRLQMAMALGQGAGQMLATPQALEKALAAQMTLVRRATMDWDESQYPFIELARSIGQMAATRAASRAKTIIEWDDLEDAINAGLVVCPCLVKLGFKKP